MDVFDTTFDVERLKKVCVVFEGGLSPIVVLLPNFIDSKILYCATRYTLLIRIDAAVQLLCNTVLLSGAINEERDK